jgi:hypothetical protein
MPLLFLVAPLVAQRDLPTPPPYIAALCRAATKSNMKGWSYRDIVVVEDEYREQREKLWEDAKQYCHWVF